jgi:hypothetical protein
MGSRPAGGHEIVWLDDRLASAALLEGFRGTAVARAALGAGEDQPFETVANAAVPRSDIVQARY